MEIVGWFLIAITATTNGARWHYTVEPDFETCIEKRDEARKIVEKIRTPTSIVCEPMFKRRR